MTANANPVILLVDDDLPVREVMTENLTDHDWTVVAAANAEEALYIPGLNDNPIVLVTDIDLGPGADGLAFASEARERFEVIGVIYISGGFRYPMPESANSPRLQFLARPFVAEMPVEAVTAMIAEWNGTIPKHC
jgi:two-component system KDP operon response regulator KdpE